MDLLTKDKYFGDLHERDISLAKEERVKKAIGLFNTRYRKYHTDIDNYILSYEQWMEGHLKPINWRYISDSIVNKKQINIKNEPPKKIRKKREYVGRLIAEEIELVRFLNQWMELKIEEIHNLLTSKTKRKADKASELDRLYFLYDIARVLAHGDLESFFELTDFPINYVDLAGCIVDIEEVGDKLYDLSLPDDYRACQMFFEMYRLDLDAGIDPDGLTKADWGAYYCYQYIYRLFDVVDFDYNGKGCFPLFLLQQQKKPFLACVDTIQRALSDALQKLVKYCESIDRETYDKYRLTSHEIIIAPIKKNIYEAGITQAETSEENIRNMVFALGHSLDALDLLCDHLAYLLECQDASLDGEKVSLNECYHQIQKLRSEIVYYTYSNTYGRQYDSAYKANNLCAIISGEELTAQSIERQLQLCDQFKRISQLIHIDNLHLLMEEKKTLTEEFMQYEKTASISTLVHEKLIDALDDVTNQLQCELKERGLLQDYNEKLRNVFTKQLALGAKELPDEMIQLLSSAEYLYHQYLSGYDGSELMEYSFIAILYYKALENLIDSQFYRPYIAPIKKKFDAQQFKKYFIEDSLPFVLQEYDKNVKKVRKHLELGTFSRLFSYDPYPEEMMSFLNRRFIDGAEAKLRALGLTLKEVASRRNDAAHGTKIITYNDAVQARTDTFDVDWEYEEGRCRGMVVEFISLLRRNVQ